MGFDTGYDSGQRYRSGELEKTTNSLIRTLKDKNDILMCRNFSKVQYPVCNLLQSKYESGLERTAFYCALVFSR